MQQPAFEQGNGQTKGGGSRGPLSQQIAISLVSGLELPEYHSAP